MECVLDLPAEAPRGIALVAHPHPLYGGTMDNKVAQTLARTFVALGYVAARFNFRGVGSSEGEHDHGRGETDDMMVMLEHMQARYPGLPVALSGFSFGTFVQAQLHQRLRPPAAARAPGADRHRRRQVAGARGAADSILIHGETDDTITLAAGAGLGPPAGYPGDRDSRRRPFLPSQARPHQESGDPTVAPRSVIFHARGL
jgi:alpha/beta superfamily hydrolase